MYPPLFERVKEKIKEGKFHPVGGSWVENDSNMPSGEALARQFIFGQRYFESRFGVRCKTAWLPDSFGLTGALPQLIRLADMDYFFTQKLSWCVDRDLSGLWVRVGTDDRALGIRNNMYVLPATPVPRAGTSEICLQQQLPALHV